MRYYLLNGVINGHNAKLKQRMFSSRNEAIEYMFNYYEKHYMYGLEVRDEHPVDEDKHNVEYVCNYYNRFTVARADS